MSLGSLLAASEPLPMPGEEAVVCVAVATLWSGPDKVRVVDIPALGLPSKPRVWIDGMSRAERDELHGRALTQLLLGEKVRVLDVRPDWAFVIALSQPSSLDPRGYPGWIPIDQLSTMSGIFVAGVRVATGGHRSRRAAPDDDEQAEGIDDRTGVVHLVDATATTLRDDPDGALVVPGVTFGTRLIGAGAAHDGWLPVAVPGRFEPAWAVEDDVTPEPATPPSDLSETVTMADRLREVPYIWGGVSAYGVDCSGLVHLTWRRFGVTLPRDAHDQATVTAQLLLGQERPGDLYFFGRPGQPIHHVGIVAAPPEGNTRQILHACPIQGKVVMEEVTGERAETLVSAHRVVTNRVAS